MLAQIQDYLLRHWDELPGDPGERPRRLSFLGQATGVSKVCFFVFADDAPSPRYIVKIPRSPVDNDDLMHEVSVIRSLRATVSDNLRDTLPGPMHSMQLSGHSVVIEPVLLGRPMDSLISPNQPLDRDTTLNIMAMAHRWLLSIQIEAPHQTSPITVDVLRQHFLEPLKALQRDADLTRTEKKYVARLVQAARALEGCHIPLYLYHGDFRPGNILINGGCIAVLDWQFCRPLAPPLLDWFSFVFRLYSRAMSLPDMDGPLEAYRTAFDQVFFSRNWFSQIMVDYTRSYCQALGVDGVHLPFLFSLFVVTNVNKFYAFLTQRAERGYLYLLQRAPTSDRPYLQQLRRQAYVWLLGDLAANPDALTLRSHTEASEPDLLCAVGGKAG